MNELKKTIREVRGTALLVALLVMGVLIALSLALSSLIIGESRSTRQLIDAGKAYYAAESGIEQALYNMDTNLPGWEGKEANIGKSGEDAVFTYEVKNQCNSYPCFDEDYDLDSMLNFAHKYYDILELNETVTIPLFTVDENGKVDVVEDFTVEFFVNFDPNTDLIFTDVTDLSGWDVLRWKVFALRKTIDNSFITESIHDFTAVSAAHNTVTDEEFFSNAVLPSWFGSVNCNYPSYAAYRANDDIKCPVYQYESMIGTEGEYACQSTDARDYYLYDDDGEEFQAKLACFPIGDFLDRNDPDQSAGATGLNYLSLTNLMNPAMLSDIYNNERRLDMSRIFFRVETFNKDTVREFASITSDGFSGDSKQSLSVEIKRDSYMPVFNFSVYSTYKEEDSIFYYESDTKGDLAL